MLVTEPSGFLFEPGFANIIASEAVAGALPVGNPHPQCPPLGLLHERLSGASFAAPFHLQLSTEMYRIRPTATNLLRTFEPTDAFPHFRTAPFVDGMTQINPTFIQPPPVPAREDHFLSGIRTMLGNGDATRLEGSAIHLYSFYRSMNGEAEQAYFKNSDGHFLIIPQKGSLVIVTELGRMTLDTGEMGMIPRGIAFQVNRPDGEESAEPAAGYVWEVYGDYPRPPERGYLGTYGMANDADFRKTTAWFENRKAQGDELTLYQKLDGLMHEARLHRSPFNVVAFQGNYVPYKYNMRDFVDVNAVSHGHIDPSSKTALTSRWGDFAIFLGGIWWAAGDTFRPPYYHENFFSEAMGQVDAYEAKAVPPGGLTVHNRMTGHGPDMATLERGRSQDTSVPKKSPSSLAFMFESLLPWRSTPLAMRAEDPAYIGKHWSGFVEMADWGALGSDG